ncbi:noc2p family domain-containing protein [Ditylenchus destructor]|uniref:Noc2p family domain-containing protein n=1 Tax=Ditylenchus destructor TaxID=166010 RepID=A0AAD4N764_9BILA|nr:noc2p family domain-containing protein [Ditylenchus destructor]
MRPKEKPKKFKDELAELSAVDPDFYKYLQEEEADIFEGSDASEGEELEESAAIDDSETFDDEEEQQVEILRSGNDLKVEIQTDPTTGKKIYNSDVLTFLDTVLSDPQKHRKDLAKFARVAVDCFISCIARIQGNAGKSDASYIIPEDEDFDEIVRLCFKHLGRILLNLLNPIEPKGKKRKKFKKKMRRSVTTFKNWHKYRLLSKEYLSAVHTFLSEIQNRKSILLTIRAILDLADIYVHFPKLSKTTLKTLIKLWSRNANEKIRIQSFVAIHKFVRFDAELFSLVYKNCYVSYIANSKQITQETLPLISFMQKSFTQLSLTNEKLACQHAFLYIRQFAIQLRNATLAKHKDMMQKIYNWQFIQGLYLWSNVVSHGSKSGTTSPIEHRWFKEVGYPLVEIISILRKAFISRNYLPLRIHCLRMLLMIQSNCNVFIPTLAISVQLLNELVDIDTKKPQMGKGSTEVVGIEEMLRLSKIQLNDAGYRHRLAEELFKVCVEAADLLKGDPAFTVLVVPIDQDLKKVIKNCKNHDHTALFKSFRRRLLSHSDQKNGNSE